jgi:hypothetical protein
MKRTDQDVRKLSAGEFSIVAHAVELLANWKWSTYGEPLGVVTYACKALYGTELHAQIWNITRAERMYAPGGFPGNYVAGRMASLAAVLNFHAR